MKNNKAILIIILSLFVCSTHAIVLHTRYNHYFFTSALKIMLFILCPVLFSYFTSTRAVKTKFFTKIERNRLKQTLVPGLVVFIFIFIVYVGLRSFLDRELIVSALLNVGVTQSNYPYIFLYIIFINAALEELFFRGFVFLNLHRMGLTKSAHLYSALLFAFYHISVLRSGATPVIFLIGIVGLAIAGYVLNEFARRADSVTTSLAIHVSGNLAINIIGIYYLYFA